MFKAIIKVPCAKCGQLIFYGKFIRNILLKKPFLQCQNCECYLAMNSIRFLLTWVIGLFIFVVIIGPFREELSTFTKLSSFAILSVVLARIGLSVSEYKYRE
jgi:hypothetical protein